MGRFQTCGSSRSPVVWRAVQARCFSVANCLVPGLPAQKGQACRECRRLRLQRRANFGAHCPRRLCSTAGIRGISQPANAQFGPSPARPRSNVLPAWLTFLDTDRAGRAITADGPCSRLRAMSLPVPGRRCAPVADSSAGNWRDRCSEANTSQVSACDHPDAEFQAVSRETLH